MADEILASLGPRAALAGVWEGEKGDDQAPDDGRTGVEHNRFRERLTFTPIGPVNNHEQCLFGLRYTTTAWRLGEDDPFHEEIGYWLLDAAEKQVMRSVMVPRGVTVLARGPVGPDLPPKIWKEVLGQAIAASVKNMSMDRDLAVFIHSL